MGQQQLLLIVLGVIIVGIAVVVGIQMFGSSAASANLDAVVSDLNNFAANAQSWYRKPTTMGGGGRSFASVSESAIGIQNNDNGEYEITGTPSSSSFVITGTGVEDGDGDGDVVEVTCTVYADSQRINIVER